MPKHRLALPSGGIGFARPATWRTPRLCHSVKVALDVIDEGRKPHDAGHGGGLAGKQAWLVHDHGNGFVGIDAGQGGIAGLRRNAGGDIGRYGERRVLSRFQKSQAG